MYYLMLRVLPCTDPFPELVLYDTENPVSSFFSNRLAVMPSVGPQVIVLSDPAALCVTLAEAIILIPCGTKYRPYPVAKL